MVGGAVAVCNGGDVLQDAVDQASTEFGDVLVVPEDFLGSYVTGCPKPNGQRSRRSSLNADHAPGRHPKSAVPGEHVVSS